MTPKEKAEELVENFYCNIDFNECYQGSKTSAKQCALICVQEILNLDLDLSHDDVDNNTHDYYLKVKQEINKL